VPRLFHWLDPPPGLPLFSAVTKDWVRVDLTVTVPGQTHGAKDRLKPLMDRCGAYEALPDRLAPRTADPANITHLSLDSNGGKACKISNGSRVTGNKDCWP